MSRRTQRVVCGMIIVLCCVSVIGCTSDADSEAVEYPRDFIDRYRPATFRQMKFGVYVEYASYLYVRKYTTEQIVREIQFYDNLGVDIFRLDIRYDHWVAGDRESIAKIERAVAEVRRLGKQLWISIYGIEAWNGPTRNDYGSASWEDWKNMAREETRLVIENFDPDYLAILPEAPSLMQNQVETEIETGEWVAFAEELASQVKSMSPNTIVVALTALQIEEPRIENRTYFREIMRRHNDIDVVGVDPYSIYELETFTKTYALPDTNSAKELWIGETWDNWNIEYRGELSDLYIKAAVYYAQSVGMDGVVLFPGGWGLHDSALQPNRAYFSYKAVINEVRNAAD